MRNSTRKAIEQIADKIADAAKMEGKDIQYVEDFLSSKIEERPELLKSIHIDFYHQYEAEVEEESAKATAALLESHRIRKELAINDMLNIVDYSLNARALENMVELRNYEPILSRDITLSFVNTKNNVSVAKKAYSYETCEGDKRDEETIEPKNSGVSSNSSDNLLTDYSFIIEKLDRSIKSIEKAEDKRKYAQEKLSALKSERNEVCEFINSHPEFFPSDSITKARTILSRIVHSSDRMDEVAMKEQLEQLQQIKAEQKAIAKAKAPALYELQKELNEFLATLK